MEEIITGLRAFIDNPDDLSELPNYISRLEEQSAAAATRETEDLERITRLQDANRNLLSQIPINTGTPPEPEDETPTFQDAQEQLITAMTNTGGNY